MWCRRTSEYENIKHYKDFCGICNEAEFLLPIPVAEILRDLIICWLQQQLFPLFSASVNLFGPH